MVERTALEMRRTREGTVGSNPTLSAIYSLYHRTFAVRHTPNWAVPRAYGDGNALRRGLDDGRYDRRRVVEKDAAPSL